MSDLTARLDHFEQVIDGDVVQMLGHDWGTVGRREGNR